MQMPSKIVAISMPLDNETICDPEIMRPKIEYVSQQQNAEAMASFFDGMKPSDLPSAEGWAWEVITLTTHNGTHIDAPWHYHSVDKDGNPTTNPDDYRAGGAILPVGADQGHKGYGLSFMVEVFSGLLTGLGFGLDPLARHNDGVFISVYNVEHFRPLAEVKKEVREFAEFVKTSPPAAGFSEVLYPGEPEYRTEQARRRDGIFVEDETWEQISNLMKELQVEAAIGQP